MKKTPKKILRRIAENILAVNALYCMNGISEADGLTNDEAEYIHTYLEKMAIKMTSAPLNVGEVSNIVGYWKSI